MKKKILSFAILLFVFIFGIISASAETVESGVCGDNLTWTLNSEGTLTISGTGEMYSYAVYVTPWCNSMLTIKSVVIENGVTSIGDYAFSDCESLASVTIPESVATIGCGAFYNTSYYNTSSNWENDVLYIGKHLIIAKDIISGEYNIKSGTLVIADRAFEECLGLTSITIPDSITNISLCAFSDCESLANVTIPDSVIRIGDHAFSGCDSLTSITIPDSVASMGDYAFSDCLNLISIRIPDSVISIGNSAFSYCTSLTSVTIGNGLTIISDFMFEGCTNLTYITLGRSIESVGFMAFGENSGFFFVNYKGTEGEWYSGLGTYECFEYSVVNFVECTETIVNGSAFYIFPKNIQNGKAIVLALYNENVLSGIYTAICYGEEIAFTVPMPYTKAKVMVWNNLGGLEPVCDFENVK